MNDFRNKLIAAGVKNLKAFGYPHANETNILTDDVYKGFFHLMLEDNLGKAGRAVDAEINQLLKETK